MRVPRASCAIQAPPWHRPDAWRRSRARAPPPVQVESTSAVLRNMQHLCNLLRPAQARQTLLHTLRGEVEQRRAAAQELR